MNGWTLAKYVLALSGLALVLFGDRVGRPWVGYVGIGMISVAFLLRFAHRSSRRPAGPPEHP